MDSLSVLGISGSLRARSHNTGLLRAAQHLAPDAVRVEIYGDLGQLPPYNQDLDAPGLRPAPASQLRRRIELADGLLIATPEYNHSVPGVLKNAIDWASTDFSLTEGVPLKGKPVLVVGASASCIGSARAQLALRQILFSTYSQIVMTPEVTLFRAHECFSDTGVLVDAIATQLLQCAMCALTEAMMHHRNILEEDTQGARS